jgi:hypothetical protein
MTEVAVTTIITREALTKVLEKLKHRLDVCRVTNGAHIE